MSNRPDPAYLFQNLQLPFRGNPSNVLDRPIHVESNPFGGQRPQQGEDHQRGFRGPGATAVPLGSGELYEPRPASSNQPCLAGKQGTRACALRGKPLRRNEGWRAPRGRAARVVPGSSTGPGSRRWIARSRSRWTTGCRSPSGIGAAFTREVTSARALSGHPHVAHAYRGDPAPPRRWRARGRVRGGARVLGRPRRPGASWRHRLRPLSLPCAGSFPPARPGSRRVSKPSEKSRPSADRHGAGTFFASSIGVGADLPSRT